MAEESVLSRSDVLEGLLGARARVAVVSWFCIHPERSVHTRELARECGMTPNQMSQQLHRLEAIGLLTSESHGRTKLYCLNPDFAILPDLRAMVLKTTGVAGQLRDALRDLSIDVAFLFGSTARGEDTADSDVDLIVIGRVSGRRLANATYPIQSSIGRAINAVRYSPREYRERRRDGDAFVSSVLRAPKLFVKGDEDDLRELAD